MNTAMNETSPDRSGRKPRVAVVFGGRSSEHGISCVTAGSVLAAIDRDAYDVVPVGIARDGRWVLEADEPGRLAIRGSDLPTVDGGRSPIALMGGATGTDLVVTEAATVPAVIGEVDVVFPLLHGPWGEDGTLQGLLEMAGVRYVGSGVLASAIGMDKAYMKVVLQAAGLPVTPGIVVTRSDWERDPAGVRARIEDLGFPSFAKPARAGSSMGISKVHGADEVVDALEEAFGHDPKVLIEQSMEGAREIECGVLGTLDGQPETSRPGEVRTEGMVSGIVYLGSVNHYLVELDGGSTLTVLRQNRHGTSDQAIDRGQRVQLAWSDEHVIDLEPVTTAAHQGDTP